MAAEKACKNCKTLYFGNKCPECGSEEFVNTFKGRMTILNPEQSEIAQKLNKKKKGNFAIKLG